MSSPSILVSLSGSKQSLTAAKIAVGLAKRSNAELTAIHVVDVNSAWQLLCSDGAGFIKRETAHSAYTVFLQILKSIANDIMDSFEELSEMAVLPTRTVTADGNPVSEVAMQSMQHDLVVIGHKPARLRNVSQDHRHIVFKSFAAALARDCSRPLLVVQDERPIWKQLLIAVPADHVNSRYINDCLRLGEMCGMAAELLVLRIGQNEESCDDLVKDLREQNPSLNDVTIHLKDVSEMVLNEDGKFGIVVHTTAVEHGLNDDVLLVIPTRNCASERVTLFGDSTDSFIDEMSTPGILFWPEEFQLSSRGSFAVAETESAS
jgi:nucleotide-binding universal stress UspA family protein